MRQNLSTTPALLTHRHSRLFQNLRRHLHTFSSRRSGVPDATLPAACDHAAMSCPAQHCTVVESKQFPSFLLSQVQRFAKIAYGICASDSTDG